jgi:NAD(P)-dependent dehydrogenase (short-subunit alcohol dehydrogenase family)
MRKEILLFGVNGSLGEGATKYFLEKEYDEYYLFARKFPKFDTKDKTVHYIETGDLSKEENVKKVFEKIEIKENTFYFLFSTIGGFWGGKSITETDYSDWVKMQNLNLNISFLLGKYFSGIVKKTSGGSICFTSAVTGLKAEAKKAAYGASKNGLIYLTKSLGLEGKSGKLSANAVAPMIIDTKENREWVKDDSIMVSPGDIAGVVDSIFRNFKVLNGNIFELSGTLKVN